MAGPARGWGWKKTCRRASSWWPVPPFLEYLAASDLSPKTIQKHVDNLWSLGGEIIRNLHDTPSLRRQSIEQILADRIDDEGGPLVYALESEESLQRSLDSTCRSCTASSARSRTNRSNHPQISPTRLYFRKILPGLLFVGFCEILAAQVVPRLHKAKPPACANAASRPVFSFKNLAGPGRHNTVRHKRLAGGERRRSRHYRAEDLFAQPGSPADAIPGPAQQPGYYFFQFPIY